MVLCFPELLSKFRETSFIRSSGLPNPLFPVERLSEAALNWAIAGMGSFYRSQHEFVCVFKSGDSPHINNIELGKYGRYRTNIWAYDLLQAKGGTTIATISKITGWQPHSVRSFFAGVVKKKLGLMLESERTKSGRIYRIVRAKTSTSAPSPSASGTAGQGDA